VYLEGSTLDIYVLPLWGIVGFICATANSIFISIVCSHVHHNVLFVKDLDLDSSEDSPSSETTEAREGDSDNETVRIQWCCWEANTQTSHAAMYVCVLASPTLYVCGMIMDLFELRQSHADSVSESTRYSLVSLGGAVADKGRTTGEDDGIMKWLQVTYVVTSIAVPLASMAATAICYIYVSCGLNGFAFAQLHQAYLVVEVLFAWSCSEVTVLSLLIAIGQLGTFSNGLADAVCPSCFETSMTLMIGSCIVLWVAVGLHAISFGLLHHLVSPHVSKRWLKFDTIASRHRNPPLTATSSDGEQNS
jgi:hypothetical protein